MQTRLEKSDRIMRYCRYPLDPPLTRINVLKFFYAQACFIRRISVAPNAIQATDEMIHFIIYCTNCVRRG